MKIIYTPCLGLIFYFGSSRIAANGSGGFAGAGIAEFGSWIRGFLRISCSAEVSQAFVIFEGNVQLWRNQHFWFWFFWKSGTNWASHVEHARLRQQVLEPIALCLLQKTSPPLQTVKRPNDTHSARPRKYFYTWANCQHFIVCWSLIKSASVVC